MSKAVKLVGALLLACAVSVGAQTFSTVLNGLVYTFPAADGTSGQVLVNNGAGMLSWVAASPGVSASMPTGLLVFSNGSCPSGYDYYAGANGFYFVGATTGLGGTVGTGLSVTENRATGNHTHSASGTVNVSSGNHKHGLTDSGHYHTSDTAAADNYGKTPTWTHFVPEPPEPDYWDWDYPEPWYLGRADGSQNSGSSGSGYSVGNTTISASGSVDSFTIGNGGTGTGTNAPYRQLRVCQKS